MIIAMIVADILMAATTLLKIKHLPPQIPLFYSKVWGEDVLADSWFIIIIPILMHLFVFLNLLINNKFFKEEAVIKKIIYFFTYFLIATFTFIFIKILFFIT